jgi:5'-nucleotidase
MDTDDVALFDMDGSLADFTSSMVAALEALRAPGEEPLTGETIRKAEASHIRARMKLIKSQPGFWLDLPLIQSGMEVMEVCRRMGFHIAILTKGPAGHSNAWDEKLQWCQRHIGRDVDVTVTFDKSRVYGKILFDDYPDYMRGWLKRRPRGLGIMPVTPDNEDFEHPNVIKYAGACDIEQVTRAIEMAKDRKPGEQPNYHA